MENGNKEKIQIKENDINFEGSVKDLIIREFERSLEHKKDVEAKAASYMVAVTLILTMLTTFLTEIKQLKIDRYFFISFTILYVILFFIGLVLLLVFVYMLKPREIQYFGIKKLRNLMLDIKKDGIEKIYAVLKKCEEFEENNRKIVQELDSYNKAVSFWVPFLVVGFGLGFVEFFVAMIISMGGLK